MTGCVPSDLVVRDANRHPHAAPLSRAFPPIRMYGPPHARRMPRHRGKREEKSNTAAVVYIRPTEENVRLLCEVHCGGVFALHW